ncbi:SAM-dependent methyltransferase [Halobacteriales archaeon QS_1_68_17]|nr:MAG: SAM-dependent methyltransferase [Halobacteriales archaeon QS_1_68_17]
MGFHTFPPERADALDDVSRYRFVSVDELLALFDPGPDQRILDVGSGTGFYTDDVATAAGSVVALDLQQEMGRRYREKGLPGNAAPVTAPVEALPLRTGAVDGAFSTMTYHEFASDAALAELARVLADGARLGVADWTAAGEGRDGPPLDERYAADDAASRLRSHGFAVERAEDRRETFVLSAVNEKS